MKNEQHNLIQKLDEFIRKYYKNKLVKGVIYTFTIVFLFFISLVVFEYFGNLSSNSRTFLFFSFLGITLFTLVKYITIPLFKLNKLGKVINYQMASEIIGNHFGDVKDKLSNTLQLIEKSEIENSTSSSLLTASINQKINELKPIPFSSAIDISKNKRYLKYAAIPLLLFVAILFVNANIIKDGANRIVNYNREFIPEAPFNFLIQNEKLTVIENENFDLSLKLKGSEIPNEVYIKLKKRKYKLQKINNTTFKYEFKNVQERKEFSFEAAGFNSQNYELNTVSKPVIMGFEIEVDYPNYTQIKTQKLKNISDLNVPKGTKITWRFKTKNADKITFSEQGIPAKLTPISVNNYFVEKSIKSNANYSIKTANRFMENPDSILFTVLVSKDQRPSINIQEKQDSLNPKMKYFNGTISDDYGFSRLTFNYRKYYSDSSKARGKFTTKGLDFNKNFNQTLFYHFYDFSSEKLNLGESIEYFFEVWDNDKINGYKSVKSSIKKIKAPTKKELEKEQEKKSENIKDKLEKNIQNAKKLQDNIKKLKESILNKKNLDWQDKQKMKNILDKQKELAQENQEIKNENEKKNQEKNEFSKENEKLKKKQESLEKLMEQLNSEEMKKLFDKLKKMMEKMDKDKIQKSLEELDAENIDMKKEMERTLEMFKQMEMDDKLEEFAEKMEELAEKQEKLSEEKDKNTKEEQEKLNKEFEEAEKLLDEIKKKNEDLENKKNTEEIEEEKQDAKEEMEESSEKLDKNKKSDAQKSQKNAAKSMKQAAKKAKESMSSSSSSAEENMEDLRALLENLITLSFDQEDVLDGFKKSNPNTPNYVKLGQRQRKIKEDAKMIEDSLFALSKRVIQIESIVNREIGKINENIKSSLVHIGERRTPNAITNQQFAMTSINNLALLLDEAMKEMQKQAAAEKKPGNGSCNNPGGSKPKPSLLPSLKKAKEGIGKSLKKLQKEMGKKKGKSPNKNGKNGDNGKKSKELARMAAEQGMIRDEINKLSQELNKDGSGLGNQFKKIQKEMEKVEEDIVNDRITQETIKRQQDILTRLLKSEKALREREFDEKRKSKSVKTPIFGNPNEFLEYKKKKERELEMLKTISPSLSPYYKNRVNEYFNKKN